MTPAPSRSPRGTGRPTLAVVALAGLLVAAACSDSKEAAPPMSDQVARAVAEQVDLPVAEITASCPADATAEAGAEFLCDVTVDDQEVTAGVAFTTDEQFGVQLAAEILPKTELEDRVREELARRFTGIEVATVDCGGRLVVVVAAGRTVDCHAEDTVGGQAIAVVGLDAEGRAVVQSVTDPAHPVPA